MDKETQANYSDTCVLLEKAIKELDFNIRVGEQNKKLRDTYTKSIENASTTLKWIELVKKRIQPLREDTITYINNRKKEALLAINNAIRIAADIIPDSMEGIKFDIDEERGEAFIANNDGNEVYDTEGSGYKSISSTFIRNRVMRPHKGILQTMICDEIFAQVSTEYSADLSRALKMICETSQVISIEQKQETYSNVDYVEYQFTKRGDYTTVNKVVKGEV